MRRLGEAPVHLPALLATRRLAAAGVQNALHWAHFLAVIANPVVKLNFNGRVTA
ncbi:MAG: hypothetical protein K6T83_14400 [Alicyclobacillus sp.]|nr:hypothetical protein [Alicyclobacillus sp.]